MKKPLLCLLLSAYSVLLIKPVIPVVADFLAHTFWYSQHMATVHLVNGKYHIHYDLYKAASGTTQDDNKGITKDNQTISDHIITSNQWSFLEFNKRPNQQIPLFTSSLAQGNPDTTYKPPRVS